MMPNKMTIDERKQRGADLLAKMLGADQAGAMRENWRNLCPDLEEYITEFVAGEIWSRPQLDLRSKSLSTISALTALGRTLALDLNIRIALSNGATRQEIVETMLHLAPYVGFPAVWEGLNRAREVFRELDRAESVAPSGE